MTEIIKPNVCYKCGLDSSGGRHMHPDHCIGELKKMVAGLRQYGGMMEIGLARQHAIQASFRTALWAIIQTYGSGNKIVISDSQIETMPKYLAVNSNRNEAENGLELEAVELTGPEDPNKETHQDVQAPGGTA